MKVKEKERKMGLHGNRTRDLSRIIPLDQQASLPCLSLMHISRESAGEQENKTTLSPNVQRSDPVRGNLRGEECESRWKGLR